ncbi:uncharacterized protein LOC110242856 [Exaiptasia diaphana]|uniref:Apple domain-containing protein n=1 Tax=Exaiptasia diaphana TaxID=2652724 RepID=A0A913XGV9_EXADI|nr:uncharacterized protein LOC110242856 [Exaiptasia diaphana]
MFYVYNLKKLDSSWKARYCIEDYINENPSKMFYSSEQSKAALKHHVSHRLYQVPNQYHCMTYCNLGSGCKSFNYNQALMTCELNNATGNMFAHQFKEHYRHYVLLT